MRLENARIRNFKLLEDVELVFSTEQARPLTVIRAENGSGKTSILLALRWCMWGEDGFPSQDPITPTAVAGGTPITVQVSVDFTERDMYSLEETRYRLIRTCEETRGDGDDFQRTPARARLLELTDRGAEDIDVGKQARISAMLPLNLANVFFTDGDAIQNFVSGIDQSERDRQEYVHQAIRQLLGFDEVESAEKALKTITRRFRSQLTDSGSIELKEAEKRLEDLEDALAGKEDDRTRVRDRIAGVDQQIKEDDRELDRIKGIGDLDAIRERIRQLTDDIEHLEAEEENLRLRVKRLLQSEELSRRRLGDQLRSGVDVLAEMEDRNIIPGMSVGLLHDRLDLGICICGVSLKEGDPKHTHILDLIERQQQTEPHLQRLTELRYESKAIYQAESESSATNGAFTETIEALRKQFTDCKDRQRQKEGDRRAEQAKLQQVDQDRVRELAERLESSRGKKSDFERQLGQVERDIHGLEEDLKQQRVRVHEAETKEQLSNDLRRRFAVSSDLLALTTGILERLKSDHVKRVSERMNQLFLDIVGADPAAESSLYSGVNIVSGSYDVVVHAQEGRTLDVVSGVNGAANTNSP